VIPAFGLNPQSTVPGVGIPVFGFFFGSGILLGFLYVFTYGAKKYHLPRRQVLHWLSISTVTTLAFAHWVELWFYQPGSNFFAHGAWLRFFEGLSSTGAMAGALLGSALFLILFRAPAGRFYAAGFEACALVWGIGRIGCALLNEHLGGTTSFFLGVRFPNGTVRHDLGLYECLFLLCFLTLYVWRRRNQAPDPLAAVAAVSFRYGAFRFFLDFLRDEARYGGLTFAQYFSLFLLALAGGLLLWRRRHDITRFPALKVLFYQ